MDKERQGPASSCYESHTQENPDCTSQYLLEAAHPADLGKRQTLMVRRREHFETLKKCFEILQEEGVSTVSIADENALGTVKKGSLRTAIVKPGRPTSR